MAGSFASGSLASGQVASSLGDIYTVPASAVAYVKKVYFSHGSATTQTVDVYLLRVGESACRIRRYVIAQYGSAEIENVGPLSTGDKIRAVTTSATTVDFVITGTVES